MSIMMFSQTFAWRRGQAAAPAFHNVTVATEAFSITGCPLAHRARVTSLALYMRYSSRSILLSYLFDPEMACFGGFWGRTYMYVVAKMDAFEKWGHSPFAYAPTASGSAATATCELCAVGDPVLGRDSRDHHRACSLTVHSTRQSSAVFIFISMISSPCDCATYVRLKTRLDSTRLAD